MDVNSTGGGGSIIGRAVLLWFCDNIEVVAKFSNIGKRTPCRLSAEEASHARFTCNRMAYL